MEDADVLDHQVRADVVRSEMAAAVLARTAGEKDEWFPDIFRSPHT
ncbi:MAG TPA: hypothetical protein VFZ00_15865 [Solirubrobacter sp.]|nr:hypothetical protein [Solirubrobacter sp.]